MTKPKRDLRSPKEKAVSKHLRMLAKEPNRVRRTGIASFVYGWDACADAIAKQKGGK